MDGDGLGEEIDGNLRVRILEFELVTVQIGKCARGVDQRRRVEKRED